METQMNPNQIPKVPYQTKDLYIASYFLAMGFKMIEPIVTPSGQYFFCFDGDIMKLELARFQYFQDGMVPAGKYASAIRQLKYMVHNTLKKTNGA